MRAAIAIQPTEKTRLYRIFDVLIDSRMPLPELPEVKQGKADMSFELKSRPLAPESELEWFHDWRLPGGEVTLSAARAGGDYYLRFHGLADFRISSDGSAITGFSTTSAAEELMCHLLIDQVMPRVMAHRGHLVMHASANQVHGGAIAFLGKTGCGKSTLAASLYQQGLPLLGDDCLLLRPGDHDVAAIPSYVGARLWPDSLQAVIGSHHTTRPMAYYSAKRRLGLPDALTSPQPGLPLRAVFLLACTLNADDTAGVSFEPVSGAQVIMELIKNSFLLDVTDQALLSSQLKKFGRIFGAAIPVYRLAYPRRHDVLPQVRKALQNILADIIKPAAIRIL